MEYFEVLVVSALFIELMVTNNAQSPAPGTDKLQCGDELAPLTPAKVYTSAEIRIMEKESRYRKELRAERMGYCLMPRQATFREFSAQSTESA